MGFADDVDLFGDGERLLDNIVKYKAITQDLRVHQGHQAVPRQVQTTSSRQRHPHATAPQQGNQVEGLLHDLNALKYFRFSVHAAADVREPTPGIPPAHAGSTARGGNLQTLRRSVTDKVMELVGVNLPQGWREFRDRIAALRSLPTHLSGGAVRPIAGVHTRVKMLYLCRDNIARFFHNHESRERAAIVGG
jgi:hypothetical protein